MQHVSNNFLLWFSKFFVNFDLFSHFCNYERIRTTAEYISVKKVRRLFYWLTIQKPLSAFRLVVQEVPLLLFEDVRLYNCRSVCSRSNMWVKSSLSKNDIVYENEMKMLWMACRSMLTCSRSPLTQSETSSCWDFWPTVSSNLMLWGSDYYLPRSLLRMRSRSQWVLPG